MESEIIRYVYDKSHILLRLKGTWLRFVCPYSTWGVNTRDSLTLLHELLRFLAFIVHCLTCSLYFGTKALPIKSTHFNLNLLNCSFIRESNIPWKLKETWLYRAVTETGFIRADQDDNKLSPQTLTSVFEPTQVHKDVLRNSGWIPQQHNMAVVLFIDLSRHWHCRLLYVTMHYVPLN